MSLVVLHRSFKNFLLLCFNFYPPTLKKEKEISSLSRRTDNYRFVLRFVRANEFSRIMLLRSSSRVEMKNFSTFNLVTVQKTQKKLVEIYLHVFFSFLLFYFLHFTSWNGVRVCFPEKKKRKEESHYISRLFFTWSRRKGRRIRRSNGISRQYEIGEMEMFRFSFLVLFFVRRWLRNRSILWKQKKNVKVLN